MTTKKRPKNAGRIDHVAITVLPQNFDACVERLSRIFGATFEGPIIREDLGAKASVAWDAGLEVVSPLKPEGPFYDRIKQQGEGHVTVVFGVENFDTARAHIVEAGVNVAPEVNLLGDEPWAPRMKVLRQARLDPQFGTTFLIGEVEFKD